MSLHFVPTEDVPYIWHQVKPLLDRTLTRSDDALITEDYIPLIMSGICRVCIGLTKDFDGDFKSLDNDDVKMVVVCEITEYPRTKTLSIHIWATKSGRDYQLWMEQFETIENFGRDHGCESVSAIARKGLAKKLTLISNWKEQSILVSKDL